MTGEDVLATSPLLFAHRGREGRLVAGDARSGARFRLSGARAATIVTAFLEPRSVASAIADGFELEELCEARGAGILIPEPELARLSLWERNGWSRPSHLLFSQSDIRYLESDDAMDDSAALRVQRRATVEEYATAQEAPDPRWLAGGAALDLPEPPEVRCDLSALVSRRSVRGFAASPPTARELAGVMHAATRSFRAAAADRAGGDPFRLLNSFYSWAHLFVVSAGGGRRPAGRLRVRLDREPPAAVGRPAERRRCARLHPGPAGVLGPGFVIFIVADLRRYAWLYRHSRAYIHVLIQVGELGQELLMAATDLGLGGWPSPAVHESRSARCSGCRTTTMRSTSFPWSSSAGPREFRPHKHGPPRPPEHRQDPSSSRATSRSSNVTGSLMRSKAIRVRGPRPRMATTSPGRARARPAAMASRRSSTTSRVPPPARRAPASSPDKATIGGSPFRLEPQRTRWSASARAALPVSSRTSRAPLAISPMTMISRAPRRAATSQRGGRHLPHAVWRMGEVHHNVEGLSGVYGLEPSRRAR